MWRIALLGSVATAVLLIACGGGSSGSVKYAPTVVPIKHLDYSGVALGVEQYQHPPSADQYPAVVATVNGKPVTGEELARQELALELIRRSWSTDPLADPQLMASQLQKIRSTNPLEAAIDEALKSQAVERLGLLPTHDEAVAYTREQEANNDKALANMPSDKHAQEIDMLRQQGFPEMDWASVDKIVQIYQRALGLSRLEHQVCPEYRTPAPSPTPLSPSGAILGFTNLGRSTDCAGFLAQERKNADIVYYVRWAD